MDSSLGSFLQPYSWVTCYCILRLYCPIVGKCYRFAHESFPYNKNFYPVHCISVTASWYHLSLGLIQSRNSIVINYQSDGN